MPNGEAARSSARPVLLRDQSDAGGERAHALQQRRRAGRVAGREQVLGALGGERGPNVPRALATRRPRPAVAHAVAVAVAVVAVPAGPLCRLRPDRRVHDRERLDDGGIVHGQLAEPHELEEAGVDHSTLVERRAAVADVVGDRGVRVTGLREADEVRMCRERPVRRHRPALDRALPVVGDAEPEGGGGRIAVDASEVGRSGEACDLSRDRGGREAALLLPALGAECGAARDQEVRRRLDVVRVQRSVREPELLGHQDRVRDLVQLRPERVGRELAVDEAVPRHRPVGQLLALEEEERRGARGREVAGGDEAGPGLVEVAGEHLAVGAEVRVRRVAGRDRLPPGRGETRHDRAGEGLVLGGLEHVRAHVVLVREPLPLGGRETAEPLGSRLVQRLVVALPALLVRVERLVERPGERGRRRRDRRGLGGAEAEREHRPAVLPDRHARRLDDVSAQRFGIGPRQAMRCIQLHEPVARRADEAARGLGQGAVERRVDRLRVVAVRRIRRRVRVGGDEHRVPGGVVDRRRVGAAVARPAAAVAVHGRVEAHVEPVARLLGVDPDPHQHRVPGRIGEVLRLDPVLAALGSCGHPAGHATCLGNRLDGVGHVARLEVGERRAVGDDVLERLDVRVVDRRVVDVAEDAVRDRVPDLGGRVAGGAEAVLTRQAEVGERARPAGSAGGCRDGHRQHVGGGVVAERDVRVVDGHVERDVGAVEDAVLAVVLVPTLVNRDLRLVRACGQCCRLERVDPVAVRVLEPRAQAAGVPVSRAAELGLEAAGRDGDHGAPAVGGPVRLVVVIELDAAGGRQGRAGCWPRSAARGGRSSPSTSR